MREIFSLAEESHEAILLHHRPRPDRFRGLGMDQFYGKEGGDDGFYPGFTDG